MLRDEVQQDVKEITYLRERFHQEYMAYVRYFNREIYGQRFFVNSHHELIAEKLFLVLTGQCPRLLINIPPRYQKTLMGVVFFISFALSWNSRAKFIHLSYSDNLALQNSMQVKDIIQSAQYQRLFATRIRTDAKAKKAWYTTDGGGVYATAAGGQVTGFGAGEYDPDEYEDFNAGSEVLELPPHGIEKFGGAIVIDDPLKADDAKSDAMREAVNDRFNSTIASRTNSRRTPIIVIMQRLHDNDLTGYLLNGGSGDEWDLLKLAAKTPDGKALYPQKHTLEELERREKADQYTFAAQYQQEPRLREGNLFKKHYFPIVTSAPRMTKTVRGWDLAATEKKRSTDRPDWTATVKMGMGTDGFVYILDFSKFQKTAGKVRTSMKNLASQDGRPVVVRVPQDPGQAGKAQAEDIVKDMAGYTVKTVVPTGDKATRAEPFSVQCEHGNVKLLKGAWNQEFIDDMCAFPSFDDTTDAAADAFNELTGGKQFVGGQQAQTL